MEIIKFDLDFWRHSLREIGAFPFYRCNHSDELVSLVEECLKNAGISSWMDRLLHRDEGWHHQFFQRTHNSEWHRQFRYITDLLIDRVIKNDIGLRGGISPVFAKASMNAIGERMSLPQLPAGVKCVDVTNASLSQIDALIDLKESNSDYIIPYEMEVSNSKIDSPVCNRAKKMAEEIIARLGLDDADFKCAVLAIDFFVRANQEIIPVEWHFPGRGLGVHFLPFLYSNQNEQFYKILADCGHRIDSFFGTPILFNSSFLPSTSFHAMDEILIKCFNNGVQNAKRVDIELDIQDNISSFYDRQFPATIPQPNHLIAREILSDKDLAVIQDRLGKWVIVKSTQNAPWWSRHRFRPKVCMVGRDLKLVVNSHIKEGNPVIIQELICDSLDNNGRFGEMRQYYFLVK